MKIQYNWWTMMTLKYGITHFSSIHYCALALMPRKDLLKQTQQFPVFNVRDNGTSLFPLTILRHITTLNFAARLTAILHGHSHLHPPPQYLPPPLSPSLRLLYLTHSLAPLLLWRISPSLVHLAHGSSPLQPSLWMWRTTLLLLLLLLLLLQLLL